MLNSAQFHPKVVIIIISHSTKNIVAGRDLGNSCKESPLETLIMRNCVKLEEVNVFELLHQSCLIDLYTH